MGKVIKNKEDREKLILGNTNVKGGERRPKGVSIPTVIRLWDPQESSS